MWSLFDNLGAVLVAGVLGLLLAVLQMGGGEAQRDGIRRSSGQGVVGQTAAWVERDLFNAGFDVRAGDDAVLDFHWSAGTGRLTFVTMSDTSTAAVADTVRYEYKNVGGRPTLTRFRVAGGAATPTASTGEQLDEAVVGLFDAAGSPVTGAALAQAVEVRVRLRMTSTLDDGAAGPGADRFVWERRFFPPNLRRLAP